MFSPPPTRAFRRIWNRLRRAGGRVVRFLRSFPPRRTASPASRRPIFPHGAPSPGTPRNLAMGEAGEDAAAAYLAGKGFAILERRVRFRRGEIDIVARDGSCWVFVEVKTRTVSRFGSAAEALTARKIRRVGRAVREYVARRRLEREPVRCDLVAVDVDAAGMSVVTHYPAAIPIR